MTFKSVQNVGEQYYLDENNETNTVMYQIFCSKYAIIHYFNEVCDPIEKTQHLIKLSERYNPKKNGWSNFVWKFYFNFLRKSKRFKYCVKFTSIDTVHLKHFQPREGLKCKFSKMNIN